MFSKYKYAKTFPEVLTFLVTNKCVCRCKHCFNWYERSPYGAIGNVHKRDLTLHEIERIFYGFDAVDYIYLAGGEPFIRQDLAEIIDSICTHCSPKTINISTNGQLTQETIAILTGVVQRYPALHLVVKVSIDGIGTMHDDIRQRTGAFERALETYRQLHGLKNDHRHLHVGINTVFSHCNQEHILDVYRAVMRLSPPPDCISQLLVRANPRDGACQCDLDLNKYYAWTQCYVNDMRAGKIEDDVRIKIGTMLMYEYIRKTKREGRRQIPCYAGIAGAIIDNEGMVGGCEHQPPYGSLRDHNYDFRTIWYSAAANRMREETYRHCFCTNEPQWWHPSAHYDKNVFAKAQELLASISLMN